MDILLTKEIGFCQGVRRALEMVQKAAGQGQIVRTLGDIVHNPQVVAQLQKLGVEVVQDLSAVGAEQIAMVTAHGAPPNVFSQAETRSIRLLDATCPLVKKVQRLAREMVEAGYNVVVCGDPEHVEVRGILGNAGPRAIAGRSLQEAEAYAAGKELAKTWLSRSRVAILFQTTQREDVYQAFVRDLARVSLSHVRELRIFNTVCPAVAQREPSAQRLAKRVDVMVVVGGRTSANTRHLAETCAATGIPTFHIERAEELQADWFQKAERVGVTAGTSTPDEAVRDVVQRLRQFEESREE